MYFVFTRKLIIIRRLAFCCFEIKKKFDYETRKCFPRTWIFHNLHGMLVFVVVVDFTLNVCTEFCNLQGLIDMKILSLRQINCLLGNNIIFLFKILIRWTTWNCVPLIFSFECCFKFPREKKIDGKMRKIHRKMSKNPSVRWFLISRKLFNDCGKSSTMKLFA